MPNLSLNPDRSPASGAPSARGRLAWFVRGANLVALPLSRVPIALTATRVALAPLVVLLALYWPTAVGFGTCLILGFLSDVFDGVLARRFGVASPQLRRFDSVADTIFYCAVFYAAWHLYPTVIAQHVMALLLLGALEVARYVFDIAKFRREASYHMWSSKLWGLLLFTGFFALLSLGDGEVLVALAIYIGIVADVEGLAISAILTKWHSDVPSIFHAYRLNATKRP